MNQAGFRSALLSADLPRPCGMTDGAGQPAGRRFDVYRNNVAVSLTEALETGFPVIAKLLGGPNFRLLAGAFLRQHPPTSPLMMHYGAGMPGFLARFAPTRPLGYLPDVARLELALRESYHAADAAPVDPAGLQRMPPEALAAASLTLAPATRLIRSRWPVHAIWRFNMEEGPKPHMKAEDVLILRPGFDPEPHLLPPGGGAFVETLLTGAPLGAAHEVGLTESDAFDPAPVLALLIGGQAITRIGA